MAAHKVTFLPLQQQEVCMLHAGKPAAGSAVPTELTGGGRIGAVLRLGQAQGQSAPANAGGTGK